MKGVDDEEARASYNSCWWGSSYCSTFSLTFFDPVQRDARIIKSRHRYARFKVVARRPVRTCALS